eukprot:800024-Rhodomonas_salina.6
MLVPGTHRLPFQPQRLQQVSNPTLLRPSYAMPGTQYSVCSLLLSLYISYPITRRPPNAMPCTQYSLRSLLPSPYATTRRCPVLT